MEPTMFCNKISKLNEFKIFFTLVHNFYNILDIDKYEAKAKKVKTTLNL